MSDWPANEPFDCDGAVERFCHLGLEPDMIWRHEDVWPVLGLPPAMPDMAHHQYQAFELQRLGRLTELRTALLRKQKIALDSVPGVGYRVVPAAEQAELAARKTRQQMQTALERGMLMARCVDTTDLSDTQRKERSDVLGRMEKLKSMVRKKRNRCW